MINFTSISAIFCDGKNKNFYGRATYILQILLPDQEKNRNCNLSLIFLRQGSQTYLFFNLVVRRFKED